MKEQHKWRVLYIAYYQQRVNKNQPLATSAEPLMHSSLSAESQ